MSIAEHEAKLISLETENKLKQIELESANQFNNLQRKWSGLLVACIAAFIVFQFSLTLLIGTDKLHFEKYQWFLPLVVTQNFLQIVSMAIVIVRFLFPKEQKKSDRFRRD